ncbi:MAG: adenosine deaminase [Proteobacteria bacterium]|nr:adenosine deaminase [Pseudomonadota bacterium]
MSDLRQFIEGLPKAELHMHLEGSLEPEMMFALAARNGVKLPYASAAETREAYNFNNLQEFLELYFQGMSVLHTEQDFHDLTWAYFQRARADNVRHAEMFFDPQGHTTRQIPFRTVINGIQQARETAAKTLGITSELILCFWRHLSPEAAKSVLQASTPYYDWIIGIGLDAAELGNPPSKFELIYDRVRGMGLKLLAHAGEEGPAEYVREALDVLKVDRIDHGNAALDDAALTQRLADSGMVLTVCPISNVKLDGVDKMTNHPLKTMLDKGLAVTVNSDDPAYFGGYINDNYLAVQQALDLTIDDLHRLARTSFTGSFLPDIAKATHLAELDAYVAGFK